MSNEPSTAPDAKRISKQELIRAVADRADLPVQTVATVYEALLVEILDQVRRGAQVNLFGFGRFYPQTHEGHPAQFGRAGKGWVDPYAVLKFSASDGVRRFLALDDDTAAKTRVPGTSRRLGEQAT